jgi:hypothetical protein
MITVDVQSAARWSRVDLLSCLDHHRAERAHDEAYAWIKALRHMHVDGVPFRERFTLRGDSLWWFAELFLHKEQAIVNAMRIIAAFDALVEKDRPLAVRFVSGVHPGVLSAASAARGIPYSGPGWARSSWQLLRMDARAAALAGGARLSRVRGAAPPTSRARVAAFVHTAFWRGGEADGSAESYIGPVLRALEGRLPGGAVRYVGIGARTNFRVRRWWDPILARDGSAVTPVERYAPAAALRASAQIFHERHRIRRSLWGSDDLRAHAVIHGCDCWPLVKQQLAGVALLQFTWSARAMDEAAAALSAIEPDVAVTYAEAGGWGRALALECRRSGVPLAGLQHGFIYRHWLNYRHEPDETSAAGGNPADRGFPFPAATLLFDRQAARHLLDAGRFPPETLVVTGSPRLDELMAAVSAITPMDMERVRNTAGAREGQSLVLFAGKEREARPFLRSLIEAVRPMPDVQLVIKPHPAEPPGVYAAATAGAANVRVLGAGAALAELLAAARAIVTVNSTVAIDALALGLPSVVIGLPNNLTPFVEAGLMIGAGSVEEIRGALFKVLYNQEFRSTIDAGSVPQAYNDGQAARRSAEAILALPSTTTT